MNDEKKEENDKEKEIVNDIKRWKNIVKEYTDKMLEEHVKTRLEQARSIAEGKEPKLNRFDTEIYQKKYDIDGKEEKFMESFTILKTLIMFSPIYGSMIKGFRTDKGRDEAVKIYKEVYERTLDVLVELGEVKVEKK